MLATTYVFARGSREEAGVETALSLGLARRGKVGCHNGMVNGVVMELQNVAHTGLDVVGGEVESALADVDADGLGARDSGKGGNCKRCEEHVGGCFVCFVVWFAELRRYCMNY